MTKAYSYMRFSSPEQMSGDSIRRQTLLAEAYAEEFGLKLDRDLTYRDLGVSSFRSQNATSGRLGDFLKAVHSGFVPNGSLLLVENLDRLSRDNALVAQNLLTQIVLAGVTIVTLSDRRRYSVAELNRDPMGLLFALINFIRANDESALKSLRMKAVWNTKRAAAASKPLTSVCPRWMTLDRATGKFVLIPKRAQVIRKIFALAAESKSLESICDTLEKANTPLWERQRAWDRVVVSNLLRNSSVMGTYVSHVSVWDGGRVVRRTRKPIPNYYPIVISAELFNRIRDARLRHNHGNRGIDMNLLDRIACCHQCGAPIVRIPHGNDGKRNLVCAAALAGLSCSYQELSYDHVVAELWSSLPAMLHNHNPQTVHGGRTTRLITAQNALDRARRRLSDLDVEAEPSERGLSRLQLSRDVEDEEAEELKEGLIEAEQAMLEAVESYQEMQTKAAARQVARALESLAAPERNRTDTLVVNGALRSLSAKALVDIPRKRIGLHWPEGPSVWIDLT